MEKERADDDYLRRILVSSSDPQTFEGMGERVEVLFHSQDQDVMPSDIPRIFIVESDRDRPKYNRFREVTPGNEDPLVLLHKKNKKISPDNFYEPDALVGKNRAKQVAIAAGLASAAVGLTLLAIQKRKK